MANPCNLQTIGKALCVMSIALILCSCDDGKQKQEVAQKKEDFLSKFDPKLKIVRDSLIAEITSVDGDISKVKKLKRGFNQESAKEFAQQKINRLQEQKNELTAHVSRIDAETEKGVMLREMNQIDGGGTTRSTNRKLLEESEKALAESRKMTKTLESEFGGSVSQSSTTTTDASATPPAEPIEPIGEKSSPLDLVDKNSINNSFVVRGLTANDVLNVRTGSSARHPVVAKLPNGARGIHLMGESVQNGETLWVLVRIGSVTGWVNRQFLVAE